MITPSDASCIPATRGYRLCFNGSWVRYYSNSFKGSKLCQVAFLVISQTHLAPKCFWTSSRVRDLLGIWILQEWNFRRPLFAVRCSLSDIRIPNSFENICAKEHIEWIWYSGMRACEHMTVRKKKKKRVKTRKAANKTGFWSNLR